MSRYFESVTIIIKKTYYKTFLVVRSLKHGIIWHKFYTFKFWNTMPFWGTEFENKYYPKIVDMEISRVRIYFVFRAQTVYPQYFWDGWSVTLGEPKIKWKKTVYPATVPLGLPRAY